MLKSNWIYTLVVLVFTHSIEANTAQPMVCGVGRDGKIVGGETAAPNEFPWMVGLILGKAFGCGGSLISDKYVLTAAHCVDRLKPEHVKAIIGINNRTDIPKENIYSIAKIISHNKFSVRYLRHDIALLKLEVKVTFGSSIRPICLPSELADSSHEGKGVTVAGWGAQDENSIRTSNFLRKVTVSVLDNARCQASYSDFKITSTHLCAGLKEGGKDACQGDSGGPLMMKINERWQVVGIVSYGYGCARPEYPGIYTRVNKFLKWIKLNTDITDI